MQQRQGSALKVDEVGEAAEPVSVPTLLLRLEPRGRAFWDNFADLLRRRPQPPLRLISWPAAPWPDIFVSSRWPWRGLSESVIFHLAVIAGVLWLLPLWPHREVIAEHPTFQKEDIIYYSPSEYLQPLDTGSAHVSQPQKGEPEYAPQPIISVPPEADNRTQTIVTPPDIKLSHDVPLPNVVSWTQMPGPVPLAARAVAEMNLPASPMSVVAPPPDVARAMQHQGPSLQQAVVAPPPALQELNTRGLQSPQGAVVAPPPNVDVTAARKFGDINIGHSDVIAPSPRLPMAEQRAVPRGAPALGGGGALLRH